MSLRDEIRQFLDEIDPKILARGKDYYRSGRVEHIEWDDECVTAEVSGSEEEPYLVEISLSEDGEIEDWSCDCPYDWGAVCKHTAAVLLALQAEEKPPRKEKPEKISVQKLVGQASREQLAALVLEHCREDRRFKGRVLSALESTGEHELSSIQELVRVSIRENTYRGYIDDRGCDAICTDLDDALDKARLRAEQGKYELAVDIVRFILLTGLELTEEADDSSGSLGYTIDAALETVRLVANSLVERGADRTECIAKLLDTVEDQAFDGWDFWRYDLLKRTAILADEQNEGKFYAVLDRLSDRRWEKFEDNPRYAREDKILRWHIVRFARGEAAARAYLEQNLDVDELCLALVREDMEKKDYASAELLCVERVARDDEQRRYQPSQWEYLLYEIYQKWGQRERQVEQARWLALLGGQGYYQVTKDLLLEAGCWEEEYPKFLAELKAARPEYEYMEILDQEGEKALLMERVRLYPERVFRFGGTLFPEYGDEICALCSERIRQRAESASDRKAYQRVCGLIQSLAEFGGVEEAGRLIEELRQAYPRRRAMQDELVQVEGKLSPKA